MANSKVNCRVDHIALFVDVENFFGYCNALGLPIDLSPELEKLTEIGKVTIRRSFGDIQKLPVPGEKKQEIRKMLQANLVLHEDIPYHNNFKNSADIRLVIEALSLVFLNDDIDLVAVVGSDRDYLPLLLKLRELGKETIGIGGSKDGTAEVYVRASDYFFYHENLCNPAPTEEATLAKAEEPAAVPAQLAQHDAPPVDEGIALLVDAVRALEARGNERVYGAAVIPMMRRLQADFDLTSSGHKSFKGLCQRVAEIGLIEIEHSGSDVHLKLVDQSETAGKVPTASGAEPVSDQPICESLRQWMEDKMKARLPSADDRMAIFQQLGEVLKAVPVIGLSELSNQISAKLKKKHSVEQQAIFKILYCLYRANSFSCSESGNQYNPIVNGFRSPVDDLKTLDICLIENNMRLYRREHKSTVDPKVWSQVFYGSDCQEVLIKEIAQSL